VSGLYDTENDRNYESYAIGYIYIFWQQYARGPCGLGWMTRANTGLLCRYLSTFEDLYTIVSSSVLSSC